VTDRVVRVSPGVEATIAARFPTERSADGDPSVHDFLTGPYAAAHLAFERGFDRLHEAAGPAVRFVITAPTPAFPPMVFCGVLLHDDSVEVAGFEIDDDYWDMVGDDPTA
jgi:hypothetical protein